MIEQILSFNSLLSAPLRVFGGEPLERVSLAFVEAKKRTNYVVNPGNILHDKHNPLVHFSD